MFKAPFSFDGRIRRTEYGLSYIIYMALMFLVGLFLPETGGEIIALILYIPALWFIVAQGAKRCHDIGNNGWYQIIPLFLLALLFQDGKAGENRYGLNPKGIGNEESYDKQISEIGKSLES